MLHSCPASPLLTRTTASTSTQWHEPARTNHTQALCLAIERKPHHQSLQFKRSGRLNCRTSAGHLQDTWRCQTTIQLVHTLSKFDQMILGAHLADRNYQYHCQRPSSGTGCRHVLLSAVRITINIGGTPVQHIPKSADQTCHCTPRLFKDCSSNCRQSCGCHGHERA